jgi:FkbM family methyltransferase
MFESLKRRLHRPRSGGFDRATLDDLRACYRLFLRREPDPEGWAAWSALVEQHHISIQMLVDGFLTGQEFRRLQAEAAAPVLVSLEGYKLYVRRNDYFIGAVIARERQYEPHVTAAVRRLLEPEQVFLDIGANIGYFTLLAASLVGQAGSVIAFEPNPANCELIRMSIAANSAENVTLHSYAVADVARTFPLDVGGTNTNGMLLTDGAEPLDPEALMVQSVVLDSFLDPTMRVDLVKLDIEGAEPLALRGMAQLIQRHRPRLLLEFAPKLIERTSQMDPGQFLELLASWGYRLEILNAGLAATTPSVTAEAILRVWGQSELSHLDLLGVPE